MLFGIWLFHLSFHYLRNLVDFYFLQNDKADYYTYSGWWSVWWSGTYSMVLSKAAFFHKKYLSLYTDSMPASIREFTTKNRFLITFIISLCSLYLWLGDSNAPPKREIHLITGTVKISQCHSSSQMLQTLLPYGLKVSFNCRQL